MGNNIAIAGAAVAANAARRHQSALQDTGINSRNVVDVMRATEVASVNVAKKDGVMQGMQQAGFMRDALDTTADLLNAALASATKVATSGAKGSTADQNAFRGMLDTITNGLAASPTAATDLSAAIVAAAGGAVVGAAAAGIVGAAAAIVPGSATGATVSGIKYLTDTSANGGKILAAAVAGATISSVIAAIDTGIASSNAAATPDATIFDASTTQILKNLANNIAATDPTMSASVFANKLNTAIGVVNVVGGLKAANAIFTSGTIASQTLKTAMKNAVIAELSKVDAGGVAAAIGTRVADAVRKVTLDTGLLGVAYDGIGGDGTTSLFLGTKLFGGSKEIGKIQSAMYTAIETLDITTIDGANAAITALKSQLDVVAATSSDIYTAIDNANTAAASYSAIASSAADIRKSTITPTIVLAQAIAERSVDSQQATATLQSSFMQWMRMVQAAQEMVRSTN